MSKETSSISAREKPSALVQNSSPRVHLLKANFTSKALARPASSACSADSVKPLALRRSWFTPGAFSRVPRSEEHTSELQSLMRISYAVFCLKKKTQNQYHTES